MAGPGRIPLLVIVGPTAAGKSELALRLAEHLPVEILSADSAQVYRGLDIGTAKPTPEERARVPHHLIDLIEPDQRFNVAAFQQEADRVAAEVAARGRLPVLVGGTGLYVRAVVERFAFPSLEPDPEVRARLQRRARDQGGEALHRELARVDPQAARRIHPRDLRRIVRALEVYELTGTPMSALQRAARDASPYRAQVVGLYVRRDRLYRRIGRRTDRQIASGWADEVRGLLARYGEGAPALEILGYRELVRYVAGAAPLDRVVCEIKRNTRHYARRQFTWLRRERVDDRLDVTGGITPEHVRWLADGVAGKIIRQQEGDG